MPLPVRYVKPKKVCSSPLLTEEATRAGDALAAVTVRSLAGLIRQLSSLARHAEGVMGEQLDRLPRPCVVAGEKGVCLEDDIYS